jgi:hypothetical protein
MAMAIPTWLDIQMGSSFQSFLRIIDCFLVLELKNSGLCSC